MCNLLFCWFLRTFVNYFLSNFKWFDNLLRKGWWYTSFIIDNNNIRMYLGRYTYPKFFSNSTNISFTYCIIPYLFLETFLLISSISLSFEPWTVESSVWPFILFNISEFLVFVILWIPWILATVKKKKHIAWHGSHALQIRSWKRLVTQTFFDVVNKIHSILVTRFLGNGL